MRVRFEEILGIWTEKRVTQKEAARVLGVSDRNSGVICVDMKKEVLMDCRTGGCQQLQVAVHL